jgi:cyanophycinase
VKRIVCILVLAIAGLAVGQGHVPVVTEPPDELAGTLFLVGGGKTPPALLDQFVKFAGGPDAKLVVIPTATAGADKDGADASLAQWKRYKVAALTLLHTRDPKKADDPAFVAQLKEATAVWMGGGDQSNLTRAYLGTAVEREIKNLLARGGVVGGTSAGAAAVSAVMITGGNPDAKTSKGLGLVSHLVVDSHFLARDRQQRLINVLARHPGLYGIGIDEGTAAVLKGRRLTVMGDSSVVVVLSEGAGRPLSVTRYKAGGTADLIALSRSAIGRTQAPWPPKMPPTPNVAKGMLIIGGGGKMPDEVIQRFTAASGGPKSRIVFIPTAIEKDPVPEKPAEVGTFTKLGATNVKVLHTRQKSEANSPQFAAAIKDAGGVWFGGGRQWRLVDSYLGTKSHQEMNALLQRGGVIGGSSAGASIQADYMVRGDPINNIKPMAEGYEQGLGFIQGVAIDQHFFKRKRLADMTSLMSAHPQLLGIGIDEQTAIVVQGEVMEVTGVSKVAVYNRRLPVVAGQPDFEELASGMRYDLKERKVIGGK